MRMRSMALETSSVHIGVPAPENGDQRGSTASAATTD